MRSRAGWSATLSALALLTLAGCEKQPAKEEVVTVDLKGNPTDPAPPVPDPPGGSLPATSAAVQPATPKVLQALGTEPFWSLEVRPGVLRYTSPENLKGTEFSASETASGTTRHFAGTLDGKPVVLTIEPGTCSDGMSDTVYPFRSSFTWGDKTERGCARER